MLDPGLTRRPQIFADLEAEARAANGKELARAQPKLTEHVVVRLDVDVFP